MGEAGARRVITDIDDAADQQAMAQQAERQVQAECLAMDVTDWVQVNAVADQVQASYGQVAILVANAGICSNTPEEDI